MIIGELDAIEWGGCCYTHDSDTRDIIKLNSEGEMQWKKEITYSNYGVSEFHLPILLSLFKTMQGDLVFLAPVGSRIGVNIIMMNQEGELIWSKEYPEFYVTEIIENTNGQLVLLGWSGSTKLLKLLDYSSGFEPSISFGHHYIMDTDMVRSLDFDKYEEVSSFAEKEKEYSKWHLYIIIFKS